MSRTKKFVGFWIVLFFIVAFPVLYFMLSKAADMVFGFEPVTYAKANLFAAALSGLAGLFWITWAYSYLHFVGKGSPVEVFGVAIYPTKYLVSSGPYAYTRNPMVLGLLFILLAVSFAIGSISGIVMILIWTLIAVFYIRRYEEPELVRRFGSPYTEYRKSVPVLLPRLRRG
ncbi:MAG TPA: isoprenylcysteine carboxylmethyltransferase family protein [Armatimonadota bacterium]|jgi:protein-S-isoprenylcysteine O-methyltransferase Ste14